MGMGLWEDGEGVSSGRSRFGFLDTLTLVTQYDQKGTFSKGLLLRGLGKTLRK